MKCYLVVLYLLFQFQHSVRSEVTGRVWHFTDVHLDPLYQVGSSVSNYCNGNVTSNKSLAARKFGEPRGDCATPRELYESAVEFMGSSEFKDADIVLFTGDFTQAGLQSPFAVFETISEAWERLYEAVPHVKGIYGTVGNHDNYPGDEFPYPFEGYRLLANIWGNWLDKEAVETVIKGGYYSVNAAPGLRIISLNTNYLSTSNPYVANGAEDPAYIFGFEMMNWFEEALEDAAAAKDKVWVLGHIPGGEWLPQHMVKYQRLIQKYEHIISGQFYGHDHEDYATLTHACDHNEDNLPCIGIPTGIVWVGPSMTEGFPSENPAIRLYDYSTENKSFAEIIEAHTYWANITLANERGFVEWKHEYSTKEEYGLENLSPQSWYKLAKKMETDWETFNSFSNNFRYRLYRGPIKEDGGHIICQREDVVCQAKFICQMKHMDTTIRDYCASIPPVKNSTVNY